MRRGDLYWQRASSLHNTEGFYAHMWYGCAGSGKEPEADCYNLWWCSTSTPTKYGEVCENEWVCGPLEDVPVFADIEEILELKPCPFCGDTPEVPHEASDTADCGNCGASIRGCNRQEAVELWNSRA